MNYKCSSSNIFDSSKSEIIFQQISLNEQNQQTYQAHQCVNQCTSVSMRISTEKTEGALFPHQFSQFLSLIVWVVFTGWYQQGKFLVTIYIHSSLSPTGLTLKQHPGLSSLQFFLNSHLFIALQPVPLLYPYILPQHR